MSEVIYSLNGKFFKDFGVYISDSKGLLDKPKPKSRKTYDWAEQHGRQIDLSPAKYDEREIELKGWIRGENWHKTKADFDNLMSEFDKEGLARLVVDFGKVLVYDVYLSDSVELNKTIRNGEIIGSFTLKIKDPNPVKKTFVLKGNALNMAFTSPDWIVLNIDGVEENLKGIVNINKTIPNRVLSGQKYAGANAETTHYITLSGNIDQITGLTTNSEEVWKQKENESGNIPIPPSVTGAFSKGFNKGFRI